MPPRPRFTKQMIEDAAFELAKQRGIEAVAAREVAKSLQMTVTPIFACYRNMSDLKAAVYARAKKDFQDYLDGCLEYKPAFQAFGLRWIRYATENPNLYRMLVQALNTPEQVKGLLQDLWEPLVAEVMESFGTTRSAAIAMLEHMLVYGIGLCALLLQGAVTLSEEEISYRLSRQFFGLMLADRLEAGDFSVSAARELYRAARETPRRRA